MPSISLDLATHYGPSTSVSAYLAPSFPDHHPTTSAIETVSTNSNGVATFTTLSAGTEYVVWDGSTGAVIEFRVNTSDSTVGNLSTTGTATIAGAITMQSDLIHTGSKVGFFGTTAASRPTAYTQTFSTAARTVPAATAAAVATTAATNSSPYGYAQAQADAIVTALNATIVDVDALKKVVNSIIDDLQTLGLAH